MNAGRNFVLQKVKHVAARSDSQAVRSAFSSDSWALVLMTRLISFYECDTN